MISLSFLFQATRRPSVRQIATAIFLTGLSLQGCALTESATGRLPYATKLLGSVVSEDPHATLAGREILLKGGNAYDAAAAVGMTLAVTLPSRAGLLGGGTCLASDPAVGEAETLDFLPRPLADETTDKKQMGTPLLGRGLFLLHARGGTLRWEQVIKPAENHALFGFDVSKALSRDLAEHSAPDFLRTSGGAPLTMGKPLIRPRLAGLLARIRVHSPLDLHRGVSAERLIASARQAGYALDTGRLQTLPPARSEPATLKMGDDTLLVPMSLMETAKAAIQNKPPTLPEGVPATGFTVADAKGRSVSCLLTLGDYFGTGKALEKLGALPARPVEETSRPPGFLGTLVNQHVGEFRLTLAAPGPQGPVHAAEILAGLGKKRALHAVVKNRKAHAIFCPHGLPPNPESCRAATDPATHGLARLVGHLTAK